MTYQPHGKYFIAGRRTGGGPRFESRPVKGTPHSFANGGAAEVDSAVRAAGLLPEPA